MSTKNNYILNTLLYITDTEIDERCFWCANNNFNVPGRETFSHIFFECPTTLSIFTKFCEKYLDNKLTELERRILVFVGMNGRGEIDMLMQIVGILLMHCIWEGKNRKKPKLLYN